jgi:hypothetical protein
VGSFNPLSSYRVFSAKVTQGPDAGLTFQGPLVLGYAGRIQVIGYLYQNPGPPVTVVGTVYGGSANLRFILPGPHSTAALEVSGAGQLQNVARGRPDGLSLAGYGNFSGPGPNDTGHWVMIRPSLGNGRA